ncbi:MAG: hypothetical protein AMJ55_08265 [Gammaproteobacteria bacterium SG8_15]|nr:MAG: hypothetical protein AMJ55_08265 [Gammaproteobacteria bacterium SG8_15]
MLKKWMLVLFTVALVSCGSADEKVAYWEAQLNNSLSSESTKEDIRNFLKQSGLDYGYIESTKTFVALDKNVENYIVITYNVAINIELDENEKLQRIKVYKD